MKPHLLFLLCLIWLPLHSETEDKIRHVDAMDPDQIKAAIGKEVIAEGKVVDAFWVHDSVLRLTFTKGNSGLSVVSYRSHRKALDEAYDGDFAKAVKGKVVRVQGVITMYYYRPQIVLKAPEQIELVPTPVPTPSPEPYPPQDQAAAKEE